MILNGSSQFKSNEIEIHANTDMTVAAISTCATTAEEWNTAHIATIKTHIVHGVENQTNHATITHA